MIINSKIKILLLLFVFLIPLISAQPPGVVQVSTGDTGFDIKAPPIFVIKEGEDFEFDFHVSNKTNGMPINSSVECFFHLDNSTGEDLLNISTSTPVNLFDYSFFVKGGNFTNGIIAYTIICFDGQANLGGFDSVGIEVTPTGRVLGTPDSILYFVLMLGVLFLFGLSLWGAIALPFTNVRAEDFSIIAISRLKYFKILLWFFSYILFVWLLNLYHVFSISFGILTQFTNFFAIMFKVMNALVYPMFVLMLIVFFVVAIKDSKIKKLIERGFRTG